jgi:predicted dienelactone hydrolase
MKHFVCSLVFLACALAAQDPLPTAPAAPRFGERGPFEIELVEPVTVRDAARDQDIHLRAYHPIGNGRFPVVVFSHGGLANREAFAAVSRHWASHGYLVLHPEHADARQPLSDQGGGKRRVRLRGIVDDASRVARIADIVAVLDGLDQVLSQLPRLGGKGAVDHERIAVAGHSLGAYVAQVLGGATTRVGGEPNRSFADARVTCVLPISAPGVSAEYGLNQQSWEAMRIPMLTITGTRDRGTRGQGVEWKMDAFRRSPEGGKFLLVIEGASHFHFGGRFVARRRLRQDPSVPSPARMVDLVKAVSVAFLDAHLKDAHSKDAQLEDSTTAKAFLKSGFAAFANGNAVLHSR